MKLPKQQRAPSLPPRNPFLKYGVNGGDATLDGRPFLDIGLSQHPLFKRASCCIDDAIRARAVASLGVDLGVAKRVPQRLSAVLDDGMCFHGSQTGFTIDPDNPACTPTLSSGGSSSCSSQSYSVIVKLGAVDWPRLTTNGFLTIFNLTRDYPRLTTYFEGELIDARTHSFLTQRWSADGAADESHWGKFRHFRETHLESFRAERQDSERRFHHARSTSGKPINNASLFSDADVLASNHLYMRWKELFLTCPKNVPKLEGASYDGFYYCCLDVSQKTIDGFYYHKQSDMQYQHLHLEVDSSGAYESRFHNAAGEEGAVIQSYGMQGSGDAGFGAASWAFR